MLLPVRNRDKSSAQALRVHVTHKPSSLGTSAVSYPDACANLYRDKRARRFLRAVSRGVVIEYLRTSGSMTYMACPIHLNVIYIYACVVVFDTSARLFRE